MQSQLRVRKDSDQLITGCHFILGGGSQVLSKPFILVVMSLLVRTEFAIRDPSTLGWQILQLHRTQTITHIPQKDTQTTLPSGETGASFLCTHDTQWIGFISLHSWCTAMMTFLTLSPTKRMDFLRAEPVFILFISPVPCSMPITR